MSSRDERREVAERLRRAWPEAGDMEKVWDVLDPILGTHDGQDTYRAWEQTFNRLADLIDPTCEVMEVPDNDEFMIRVVSGFMCKRCGHEAIVERNCDGSAEPPNYCPHCGARVTDGGER